MKTATSCVFEILLYSVLLMLFSVGMMAKKLEKKLVQVIHEEDVEMMDL